MFLGSIVNCVFRNTAPSVSSTCLIVSLVCSFAKQYAHEVYKNACTVFTTITFSRRSRLRGCADHYVPKDEPDRWRPRPHAPEFRPSTHRCPLGIRDAKKKKNRIRISSLRVYFALLCYILRNTI